MWRFHAEKYIEIANLLAELKVGFANTAHAARREGADDTLPDDTRRAFVPSLIRVGTYARQVGFSGSAVLCDRIARELDSPVLRYADLAARLQHLSERFEDEAGGMLYLHVP